MIDYRYLLTIPNLFYGLNNTNISSEGIELTRNGCLKSNLKIEQQIIDLLESRLYPRLEKSESINNNRVHKTCLLNKDDLNIIKKSSIWNKIIKIASYGLKRTAFVSQASITYLDSPNLTTEYGNQRWHHDNKGNQVKCMILLTNNSKNGQVTSYINKSHKFIRLGYDKNSRLNNKLVKTFLKKGAKTDLYGEKGEIYFIHTNGAHRGNCMANSDERTLLTINFTPRFARRVKNELFH